MNADFRIKVGFFDHPKTIKLHRRLGAEAVLGLLRLLEFTAVHRPKGVFHGLDEEDLLVAARWERDEDLLSVLTEVGFLEQDEDGVYVVHDWQDHNGWAYFADERSERARSNAYKRWRKDGDASSNASGNANSNAPSPTPTPEELIVLSSGTASSRKERA